MKILLRNDVRNRSGSSPSELIPEIQQFSTCQVLLCKHRSVDLYILNMIIVWLPQKQRVPVEEHPQKTVRVSEALGFNRWIFFGFRHFWTSQIIPRNMNNDFSYLFARDKHQHVCPPSYTCIEWNELKLRLWFLDKFLSCLLLLIRRLKPWRLTWSRQHNH